jgi:hypothetical protein
MHSPRSTPSSKPGASNTAVECLIKDRDYPGTRVKEWFAAASFEELDQEIALRGGDRRAIIKSDIALRIPALSRPIFFHAESRGRVAPDPPTFTASVPYPWLTPETFNGWFIPDGASKRLGEMEFEESLSFDFRAKSLGLLIDRLEELNAALNFGSRNHITRRKATASLNPSQASLFSTDRSEVLLVVGHKCAGKSTFSDFLTGERNGVFGLEASMLLRNLAAEDGVTIDTSADALVYLQDKGWDIVAESAAAYVAREGAQLNVVTGLRTVEELLLLRRNFPQAKIVLIEADLRTRFERHIKRAREGDARSFQEFQLLDEEQARFGAMRVAHEISDIVMRNDDDIRQYHRRIDDLASHLEMEPEGRLQESELHRSVRALRKIGRAATCDEIAEVTAEQGPRVRKYNNNRALKSVPEFATRVRKPGQLLKYKLSSRGAALLELLDLGFQDVALRRPRAPGRSTPSPKAYRRNAADRHSADE